jgi:hypothetical protein
MFQTGIMEKGRNSSSYSFSFASDSPAEFDELVFLLGQSRVRGGSVGRDCPNHLEL